MNFVAMDKLALTLSNVAAMGGIFTLGECAAKGVREQDDAINAAIGGCAAGMLAGIKSEL